MRLTSTHTFALLEVSQSTYDEIAAKLKDAGYEHVFIDEGEYIALDMHGIGIIPSEETI